MNSLIIELTVASQRPYSLSLSISRCHPMITGSGGRDCYPGTFFSPKIPGLSDTKSRYFVVRK